MKFKDLFPALCIALLIISEVFLFSANSKKSAALAQLAEARQQLQDLQTQLAQATNDAASAASDELTKLRADNQDVPRMRKQIEQLQDENQKLSGQLRRTSDAAQQQQEQLQEIEAESEQAAEDQQAQAQAAQAQARIAARERLGCIANLRLIYAAKQAWALDKNKTDTDTPTEQDLLPYLKGNVFPTCPSGGVYTIGAVGQSPTCSITGHVLPAQ